MKKLIAAATALLLILAFAAGCAPQGEGDPTTDPTITGAPATAPATDEPTPTLEATQEPTPTPVGKEMTAEELVAASELAFGSIIRAMYDTGAKYDMEDADLVWTAVCYAASTLHLSDNTSKIATDTVQITEAVVAEMFGLVFKNTAADRIPAMPADFELVAASEMIAGRYDSQIIVFRNSFRIDNITQDDEDYMLQVHLLGEDGALLSSYSVFMAPNVDSASSEYCPLVVSAVEPLK